MFTIITPNNINPKTGGQKYNYYLYEIIKERLGDSARFILDKDFGDIHFKVSVLFNFYYLKKLKRIKNDIVLFDSRMFPRLFLFLIILRILYPKTKIVATHHHFSYKTRTGCLGKCIVFLLEWITLKISNEVIIPSEYTLALSKKYLNIDKLVYIPLGFDFDVENNGNKKIPYPIKILNVGTICKRKRTHLVVDIMKQLPKNKYEFHLVGGYVETDPYFIKLKKRVTEEGFQNCILFRGRLSDADLNQVYNKSDLFAFTSSYEGFGMVLAEAMGRGLPVIAFNNSAIPYVLKNGETGYIVEEGNIGEFANLIDKLSCNKELYVKMSKNAKEHSKKFPLLQQQELMMKDWLTKRLGTYGC